MARGVQATQIEMDDKCRIQQVSNQHCKNWIHMQKTTDSSDWRIVSNEQSVDQIHNWNTQHISNKNIRTRQRTHTRCNPHEIHTPNKSHKFAKTIDAIKYTISRTHALNANENAHTTPSQPQTNIVQIKTCPQLHHNNSFTSTPSTIVSSNRWGTTKQCKWRPQCTQTTKRLPSWPLRTAATKSWSPESQSTEHIRKHTIWKCWWHQIVIPRKVGQSKTSLSNTTSFLQLKLEKQHQM